MGSPEARREGKRAELDFIVWQGTQRVNAGRAPTHMDPCPGHAVQCSAVQCSAGCGCGWAGLGWASLSPSPSPSPSPLPEQQHMASCSPLVNPGDVSPALAPPVQPPATLNSIVLYTHTYEQKEEEEEEEEAPRPLTRNLGPGCKILHSLAHPSIHPPIHPRLSHPNVFMPCSQAACTPLTTPMHLAKARIQPFSLHWPSPVAPLFPAPPCALATTHLALSPQILLSHQLCSTVQNNYATLIVMQSCPKEPNGQMSPSPLSKHLVRPRVGVTVTASPMADDT
ncbi:hypothetical protein IWX49DRAFT_626074 [Phyllosticta citricarpa]